MNSITLLGNFIAEEMSEEKKLAEKIYSQIESSGLDPTDVLDELVSINSKMQSNKEDYQSYIGDNDE